MSRWRLVAGVGVVAALAVTVTVLSLRGDSPPPSSTTTVSTGTSSSGSTSTTTSASTTTIAETTSTTTAEQRLAEVEELLGDLWFGWFDAIYRKDPDALWQVVATTTFHEDGVAAMESMKFTAAPTPEGVRIDGLTILLDRPDCLVVEHVVNMSRFRDVVGDITVRVLWPDAQHGYRFATAWQHANDLWLGDCDDLVREETP